MTSRLARRQLALAAAALLAATAAGAAVERTHGASDRLPPRVGAFTAVAGRMPAGSLGQRTLCGALITSATEGIAQPTLPCGTRLYVTLGSTTVLAEVIARAVDAGRAFDLTGALADRLGLDGVRRVRWSYAA